jgi:hypothetical protein
MASVVAVRGCETGAGIVARHGLIAVATSSEVLTHAWR